MTATNNTSTLIMRKPIHKKLIHKKPIIRKPIIRKPDAAAYTLSILSAVLIMFCKASDAEGAELPERYQPKPAYQETIPQNNGWLEIDGHKYYLLPALGQMASGWLHIDGQTFYFLPDSRQMATGWTHIDDQTFYFLPDSGQLATGWTHIDDQTFYFLPDSGQLATGWTRIDDQTFYFLPDSGQLATGWLHRNGISYYFNPDSGQLATGWTHIDDQTFYFLPDSGQLATKWQEINGKSYYFHSGTGQMATGCLELGNDTYYFSPDTGEMLTGWQETEELGRRYFSDESGCMATGWQNIDGKTYYFSKDDGEPTAGIEKIDGEYYLFHANGQLAASKKVSLVTVGKQTYCADANGQPVSGWQMIGKKLYYATKTGKTKKNTTYRGITFGSNGAAKNNLNTRLKIKAMEVLASITTEAMTNSQKLAECWSYLVGGSFRYAAKYPNLNAAGWQRQTAYDMLSSKAGNCYSYACAFAALAEEAGYRPSIICGRVRGSRDRMADGYTRHAWVLINGRYYDPEAHYAGWKRGIYNSSSYPVSHKIQQIVQY